MSIVKTQAELDAAIARGDDRIEVRSPASVVLVVRGSASVTACGSASVRAYGSASVTAYGSASVTAYDSASVTAYDSASVTACDSASVTAYGSASVTACDSASVRAYGSASVTAYGSASVTAYGSASVTASKLVAVHKLSARAKISGGVVLDHTGVEKFSAAEWCEYHGVKVSRGIATLYKAVNDKWTTTRGFDYSPGSRPACNDFSDTDTCGGGLHFGPTPAHALSYFREAAKFVAVGVRVSELRPINGGTAKAKAPRVVRACVEVDIHGKEV